MAQKRSLLTEIPPVSSSEEEEEEESASEDEKGELESEVKPKSKPESDDDDEEEDESEEENEKTVPVKVKKPSAKKSSAVTVAVATATVTPTKKPQYSSGTDEGSGSESDSGDTQQSPTASAFTIKPNLSKLVAVSESKKPAVKSTSQVTSTPMKPTGKRPAETLQNGKDSRGKKSKVSEDYGKSEEKKSAVTRVWSDKDEIAILDGIVRYKLENGSDPIADTFKDFLKDSIRADVSKAQLSDKIRRLKKKYMVNAEKGENSENHTLKPHELRIFELSKKIWGSNGENNNGSTAKKKKKIVPIDESKAIVVVADPKPVLVKVDEPMADENQNENESEKDLCSVYPRLYGMFNFQGSLAEDSRMFLKENIGLIGSSKAKEMDEKWKNLQMEEFEVYAKRIALINEQTKMVLDAFKSSKNW